MKFAMSSVLVVLAFVFILFLSLYGGCKNFQPFSFAKGTLHGYPYEGFASLGYTTYPDNQLIASDSYASKSIIPTPLSGDRTRVKGFDGLLVSPTIDDSSLDIYSKAKGNPTAKSYGLMNSQGYLVLDQNQIKLLESRGGNASGSCKQ